MRQPITKDGDSKKEEGYSAHLIGKKTGGQKFKDLCRLESGNVCF